MSSHTAICCRNGSAKPGVALATELRRMGAAVDLLYTGKLDKQFKRAKLDDPAIILTIREDMTCRMWFRWRKAVECSLQDARHYLVWLADETDLIADPPDFMLDDQTPAPPEPPGSRTRRTEGAP